MNLRRIGIAAAFGFALCAYPSHGAAAPPAGSQIAVTVFAGGDRSACSFLSQALAAELQQLGPVADCGAVASAAAALKPAPNGPLTPDQARAVARKVGAKRVVTGSCLVHDEEVVVTGRVLGEGTAEAQGAPFSATGPRKELLALAKRLAATIGGPQSVEAPARVAPTAKVVPALAVTAAPIEEVVDEGALASLRGTVLPAGARAGGAVSEADLGATLKRLAGRLDSSNPAGLILAHQAGAVSRLRVVTALARLGCDADMVNSYKDAASDKPLPDDADIPGAAKPYVAAVVEAGWWMADEPLNGRAPATWDFVATIVGRMPLTGPAAKAGGTSARVPAEAYTGLMIDASGLGVQRTMSPRILDEDGNVVYPDPKCLPSYDYLEDHGMAAYAAKPEDSDRAGARPFTVKALRTSGPGHDDLVVSNDVAAQIRQENRKSRFVARWAVCILSGPR